MKKPLLLVMLLAVSILGACSTTTSSGSRTLSPDSEQADPIRQDSAVVDTLSRPE